MKHLGDVCKISGWDIEPVDVLTGGSPCQDLSVAGLRKGLKHEELGDEETTRSGLFMEQIRIAKEMRERDRAMGRTGLSVRCRYFVWENVCFADGTLVTCDSGYKKIEDVCVGDKVKTASGSYCPVIKTHKTPRQRVIRLSVSGAEDVIVTPNHPFLVREKTYPLANNRGRREVSEPRWESASNLTKNHLVAYRIDIPRLPEDFITEEEAWAIGRWLADGSVDIKKSNPRIFISSGLKKEEDTFEHLSRLPYEIHKNRPHETAINFCFTSREFYSLIASAGVGAGNKRVPPFVFDLPYKLQEAILDGYISGDGMIRKRGKCTELQAGTSSRELAYGISRLIRNVHRVSANISVRTAKNATIGNRVIQANYPAYSVTACLTSKVTLGFADDEYVWQPVKAVKETEKTETVYNLSVLGDNTYGANDIVVHNCGAYSRNGGRDFQTVLTEIIRVADPTAPVVPLPEGGWPKYGCYYSEMGDWSLAYRTVDAQFFGTPQRRKRIALLCDFNGLTAPEILFDPQLRGETEDGESDEAIRSAGGERGQQIQAVEASLPGNPQQGRTEGEGTPTGTERDVGAAGEFKVMAVDCRNYTENPEINGTLQAKREGTSLNYNYVVRTAYKERHKNLVYDARGNGRGTITPTITGDHQNRVTDYTAIVVEASGKAERDS